MSGTAKVYQGQPATGSPTTLYAVQSNTSPNGEMAKEVILTNTTSSNATITLCIVSSGGTAGVANAIAYNYSLGPNQIAFLALTTDMEVGDFYAGSQGTANAITVTITNYRK